MQALVVGKGTSAKSACKLCKQNNISVRHVASDSAFVALTKEKQDRLLCGLSFVVFSSGIPKRGEMYKMIRQKRLRVVDEIELAFGYENAPVVAVSGTNGKTTTTTLIYKCLCTKFQTLLGGNIGVPYAEHVQQPHEISVLEVSSYQLEKCTKFRPHIGVMCNITPDHIAHHGSMEAYVEAKAKLFARQTKKDFAVLNADDAEVMRLQTKAQRYYFSLKKEVVGCFLQDGCIYFKDKHTTEPQKLIATSEIGLLGAHNIQNVMACMVASYLAGVPWQNILSIVRSFRGVAHRLQHVLCVQGVTFYNDSKATNVASSIVAMQAICAPKVVILGGSDKGFSFDDLFMFAPASVKAFVLTGEVAGRLERSASAFSKAPFVRVPTLKQAVMQAWLLAEKGDCVLFSPACASFDAFKNYAQRGRMFCTYVRELKRNASKTIKEAGNCTK